jgi:hypothetical protein
MFNKENPFAICHAISNMNDKFSYVIFKKTLISFIITSFALGIFNSFHLILMNRHKIQERYKALNEGDKQSYDIKLDK